MYSNLNVKLCQELSFGKWPQNSWLIEEPPIQMGTLVDLRPSSDLIGGDYVLGTEDWDIVYKATYRDAVVL